MDNSWLGKNWLAKVPIYVLIMAIISLCILVYRTQKYICGSGHVYVSRGAAFPYAPVLSLPNFPQPWLNHGSPDSAWGLENLRVLKWACLLVG